MDADLFPAIASFARVAHHANFTRAAAELGVSPSALSQTMRGLESRLGMRLLERTTRRVGLTEIGQRFLSEALPALAALAGAVDGLNEWRDRPSGVLRLNVSRTATDIVVMPHLADFLEAYPDITVDLHCDNALVDLVEGGFDAGIRISENLAQDVVALPLGGSHRIATVAAPRYLAGRDAPQTPAELVNHRCINVRLPSGLYRWEFSGEGRTFSVDVKGPIVTNDGDTVLSAVRTGAGIALAFETQVIADIAQGRLVPLLEPWWPRYEGFHIYFSSRLHVPRKLRAFIDFMQSRQL
jgi:DNA-binding transcriptional LysR family regulator